MIPLDEKKKPASEVEGRERVEIDKETASKCLLSIDACVEHYLEEAFERLYYLFDVSNLTGSQLQMLINQKNALSLLANLWERERLDQSSEKFQKVEAIVTAILSKTVTLEITSNDEKHICVHVYDSVQKRFVRELNFMVAGSRYYLDDCR